MRIAICDDEKFFRGELRAQLDKYAAKFGFDFACSDFSSGDQLLASDIGFDLIFMDYRMSSINGIDTVDRLRKRNDKTTVIFISSCPDAVFDSLRVQTHRFLVKPLDFDELCEALDSFMEKYNSTEYILACDEENDRMKRIPECDIVYAEADNTYCRIVTGNGCYLYRSTLSELAKSVKSDFFYRSHRSYLVNMNYVENYSRTEIVFENGERALLTKTKHFDFQKKYMAFLKHGKRELTV